VHIAVNGDKNFCRKGNDLIIQETISFPEAVLGVKRTIILPDGTAKVINIPAGIQFGEAIVLKGLGFIGLENNEKGNLQVSINIPVPCKVSKTTQHIIEKLQAELKDTNP
jgi:molecular chaperone DnaJ